MAELKDKLPQFCVPRERKNYTTVYFSVPKRLRPEGWKPSYEVGRTDKHTIAEIIARGRELYAEYKAAKKSDDLHLPTFRKGSLAHIITLYKQSEHYKNLKPATQKGYISYLNTIRKWSDAAGNPHIKDLTLPTAMAFLDLWQDAPRTRKYYKAILSKLFQVAHQKGYVTGNLMKDVKLPKAQTKKTYKVWREEQIYAFNEKAKALGLPNVGRAAVIAWEGFRQTDIFNCVEPFHYRDGRFRFKTSKTNEQINCPAYPETIECINERPEGQVYLTVNDFTGEPWTVHAFSKQFRKVCEAMGLKGYQFRKIRNSAAIDCLKAELTEKEFKQRFGWSKEMVEHEIDYYTDIDQEIIDSASEKILAMKKRSTFAETPQN